MAHRLRMLVAATPFTHLRESLCVTVSVGVATTSGGEAVTAEELIEQTDARLYVAKQEGRNRVVGDE